MGPQSWEHGYTFLANTAFVLCAVMFLGALTVVVRTERLRVRHARRVAFHPTANCRLIAHQPFDWQLLPEYTT